MKRSLLTAVLILSGVGNVAGWSHEGHEAIADAALANLSTGASAKVMAIINDSSQVPEVTTIAGAATWPDDIKDAPPPYTGKFHATPAALDFKARFPEHKAWHFVNYPLEGAQYSLNGVFSQPNDIVHQISLCIDVLEGKSASLKNKEALCFLVHLVGDLHQPLHVSCGFYTMNSKNKITLVRAPTTPHAYFSDGGGNGLKWKNGAQNFHHFWDDNLVAANSSKESKVVALIEANMALMTFTANVGPVRGWASAWVNDSITRADAVYFDASGAKAVAGTDPYDPLQPTITTTNTGISEATYKSNHKLDAKNQLTKGAHNLAELLNSIQWP